jgi:hypothetical protein
MPNDRKTVYKRKHAIKNNNSILSGFTEALPLIPVDSEIGLVAARCEKTRNLFCRFCVILDDENAA